MANITTKKQKIASGKVKNTKIEKPVPRRSVSDKEEEESEEESEEEESEEEESESEDNGESVDEDEDEDEDDELDVDAVSSDSDSDSETGSEEDEELPKLKKKKNKDDGSASFSTAVSAILGSKLKKHDRSDPVLVRSKKTIKKFEEDKLELKLRRLINLERKLLLNANRVKQLLPTEDSSAREMLLKEKQFKKIAQRGVIKLFNAVLLTQTSSLKAISGEKILGADKKEELINEISKEKFLDLVLNAGK